MRILDRYILKSILAIFLGSLFTFAFLFILIDVFGNLQDFIEKQVPYSIILEYYLSFLPTIIVQTSSMGLLIATLFTYSQLNSNNEIVAIRASGMNFWQITRPALIFAIFVSAAVFLINEKFVPQSATVNQEIRESKIKVVLNERTTGRPIIKNLTFYGLKNRLFFIDSFDPNTSQITGITIIGHDGQQNLVEKIVALKGSWTGVAWKFFNVQATSYKNDMPNVVADIKIYPDKLMDIKETPRDFIRQRLDVNAMNIRQLHDYISRFSGSGAIKTINNIKVDYYEKMAFPVRNLIIILVGLPLVLMSTGKRKAMTFASIAIAMVIGFLYYVVDAVGIAVGKGGGLPPWAGAWLAPFIFAIISLIIKRRF